MANKKNKKKNPKVQKKVTNKLSNDNQAAEIAYKNNVERISGAILLGQELNPKNSPLSFAIKVFKKNKMPLHMTNVENGAIESVTPCLRTCTNITKPTRTIQRYPGIAYTVPCCITMNTFLSL